MNKQLRILKDIVKAQEVKIKGLELDIKKLKQQISKTTAPSGGGKSKKSRRIVKARSRRPIRLKAPTIATTGPKFKVISAKPKKSRKQYLTEQKVEFIDRFIRRIVEDGLDFSMRWEGDPLPEEKINMIEDKLLSWDIDRIDAEVKSMNLHNAYYPSDGTRDKIKMTGNQLFDNLVGDVITRDEATPIKGSLDQLMATLKQFNPNMDIDVQVDGQSVADYEEIMAALGRLNI